ncbi:MAG: GGDEF domain-containing protein [Anaerolineales bacterium]|nr:GGDEF domain-containing protein [Anaerolineales bacterium]
MIDQIRTLLLVRDEPELREHRSNLARGIIIAFSIFLAAFLLGDLIQFYVMRSDPEFDLVYDLVILAILGGVAWIAWRLNLRGETIISGYFLSVAIFLVIAVTVFLYPQGLLLFSPAFILPILIISSIIGDLTIFPIAFAEMIVLVLAWLNARRALNGTSSMFITEYGFMFFLVEIAILSAVTILLFLMSRTIRHTVLNLHSQSDEMTQLAYTDPLTELANRRYLVEQLQREFDRAKRYQRPLSLIYLDLDGFKSINDHFGHMFGDEVLRSTALAMSAVLRSTDLLARIGGDEFAVLLPETTIKGSQGVVVKLRKSLAATGKRLGPAVPELSFCAGIGQMRETDPSIDALLSRADDAQYMAKSSGTGLTRTQIDIDQLPLFEEN